MNLSCYLIDDEPAALRVLEDFILRTPGLTLAGQTTDPLAGLEFLTNGAGAQLTFLDVDMPQLSGLALAGLVSGRTTLVFTTAFREYAADAYDKDVIDFLHKPFGYERFLRCIQKAGQRLAAPLKLPQAAREITTLYVKTGIKGQVRSVQLSEITHATAALNYLEIFLKDDKVITYLGLNELLEKLPAAKFSRIHKSHLVNHDFIRNLEHAQLRLKDAQSTVLPIGRTYRSAFREKMNDLLLISKRDHPA